MLGTPTVIASHRAAEGARRFLQLELEHRCQRNPKYSLRAFAKALGLSHTVVSLFLSGHRSLSKKAAQKIVENLALPPDQEALFSDPFVARTYDSLELDSFAVISEWYHYAILSLLELPDSRYEARWIAARLGISHIEAKLAMDRLLKLGLVKKNAQGRWRQAGNPLYVGEARPSAVLRKYYKQLLEKALYSLENDPLEARDFSSITFAVNPKFVPHAEKRIREFRRRLVEELEKLGEPTAVYHLTVQLFPGSRTERGKNETHH